MNNKELVSKLAILANILEIGNDKTTASALRDSIESIERLETELATANARIAELEITLKSVDKYMAETDVYEYGIMNHPQQPEITPAMAVRMAIGKAQESK